MKSPAIAATSTRRVGPALAWGLVGMAPLSAFAQCPSSTLQVEAAAEVAPWSEAMRMVRETLAGTDRPWHCAGATVHLRAVAEGGLGLEVALPSGTTLRRRVRVPAELVPTLQAALIVDRLPALEFADEPTPAANPPTVPPEAPAVRRLRVRAEPAAFIEGVIDTGPRVGATPSFVSYAIRATVVFRIRAWSLFAWGRLEPWTLRLVDRGPGRYLLDGGALGVGATLGWPLGRGRVEAGLTLSTDSYTWRDQALLPGQKETVVQVRLGTLARWRSHARGAGFVATLDADLSPVTPFLDPPGPTIPRPPAWSAGLMLGVSYGGAL